MYLGARAAFWTDAEDHRFAGGEVNSSVDFATGIDDTDKVLFLGFGVMRVVFGHKYYIGTLLGRIECGERKGPELEGRSALCRF